MEPPGTNSRKMFMYSSFRSLPCSTQRPKAIVYIYADCSQQLVGHCWPSPRSTAQPPDRGRRPKTAKAPCAALFESLSPQPGPGPGTAYYLAYDLGVLQTLDFSAAAGGRAGGAPGSTQHWGASDLNPSAVSSGITR